MTPSAETSTEITRRSRSNLAFALLCLPKERRRDMVSFYAFCRLVDDIADEGLASVDERRATLEECRRVVLNPTQPSDQPILNETAALPARYGFDPALLSEIIDGVASDLDHQHYATLEDLMGYCYKVASVVGLVSIHIFGHQYPATRDYAVHLGYALQITNIMRDVGEDARDNGRIYLPADLMQRFGVTPAQVMEGRSDSNFLALMSYLYGLARSEYDQAQGALPPEDRPNMIAAEMMAKIYSEILEKMRAENYPVFERRVRLHPLRKAVILASALVKGWVG
jgi:phytoene synthase